MPLLQVKEGRVRGSHPAVESNKWASASLDHGESHAALPCKWFRGNSHESEAQGFYGLDVSWRSLGPKMIRSFQYAQVMQRP